MAKYRLIEKYRSENITVDYFFYKEEALRILDNLRNYPVVIA